MKKNRVVIVIVSVIGLILVSGFIAVGLSKLKPEPPKKPEVEMVRHVKVTPVQYENVTSGLTADGRLMSTSEVMLVSEASGRIETGDVPLKKGSQFKKGQRLFTIYKDEAELSLKASKSGFLNSVANLLPDIKVDYSESFEAFHTFFMSISLDKDLPPLPKIENIPNEKLRIFLASRNILGEYYRIKKEEKALKRFTIYAPFNGTFTQVNFEVGAFINMGGQVGKMIRIDAMELEVPIKNGQSHWIQIGDEVFVTSQNNTYKWTGRVVRKAPFVDPNTQSRSIFVKVTNNGKQQLMAGEYLNANFNGREIDQVMEIPRSAVFNNDEVFVVANDRLQKQKIEVVKINEKSYLFRGLSIGTDLVIEPLINVKENAPVKMLR